MCFTRNQAPIDTIYRSSSYIETFKDTFLSDRDTFPNMKIKGRGVKYKDAFLVTSNVAMDLKNGLTWKKTGRSMFKLGIQPRNEMPEIRQNSIDIQAGYKTTIWVNIMQLESDTQIKILDVKRRKCKFPSESDELRIFNEYSR